MYYDRMRAVRKDLKLSQTEIAAQIGIDQRQYSEYERGVHEMPIRYLIAFLKVTGADPRDILELNEVTTSREEL